MEFSALEATGLFVLWVVQFFVPELREEIIYVYAAWAAFETLKMLVLYKRRNAFQVFNSLVREQLFKRT
jgi:hypothetical protein